MYVAADMFYPMQLAMVCVCLQCALYILFSLNYFEMQLRATLEATSNQMHFS